MNWLMGFFGRVFFTGFLCCMVITSQVFPQAVGVPSVKPVGYVSSEFPTSIIILKQTDNPWLMKGDELFSAYQDSGNYYAIKSDVFSSDNMIIKAFPNDKLPVKTGLSGGESPVWAVWRDNKMNLLTITTRQEEGLTFGKAVISENTITILDNKYYSLDPVWPEVSQLETAPPKAHKYYFFYEVTLYRSLMPLYCSDVKLEIAEGDAVLKYGKYFNETSIKISPSDIARGHIDIIIRGKALKNSKSTDTFRKYRLFWK